MLVAQLPVAAGDLERWLIPAAAVLYIVTLVQKVFTRKPPAEIPFATRTELNNELNAVRDKIDARFLSLTEKIEAVGTSIHTRLSQLDAAVARVDERTKK
jgi:hypothetical protein